MLPVWKPESLSRVMVNLIIKINFYCCICMCHIQQKRVLDPWVCEFPVNLMRFIITRKKEKQTTTTTTTNKNLWACLWVIVLIHSNISWIGQKILSNLGLHHSVAWSLRRNENQKEQIGKYLLLSGSWLQTQSDQAACTPCHASLSWLKLFSEAAKPFLV